MVTEIFRRKKESTLITVWKINSFSLCLPKPELRRRQPYREITCKT